MVLKPDLHWAYAGMVMLGISLFLIFRPSAHYSSPERRKYFQLQAFALLAAILGAKFVVLMGDAGWPLVPFHDWTNLLISGRSIVGALLFGFIVAEGLKPLLGYKLPPNDRFAIILPFSVATGRLGCWMSGCCLGIPMTGPFSLVGIDGVSRFPAPLVEMAFHLLMGTSFILLWRRKLLTGRLFALYLVAYGVFRFFTEFLRVTPKVFDGLSAYQWFSIPMVVAGAMALWLRREPSDRPVVSIPTDARMSLSGPEQQGTQGEKPPGLAWDQAQPAGTVDAKRTGHWT